MRRIILTLFIIGCFNVAFTQTAEEPSNFRKNDILVDPFWLIGGLALNASYERIISEDSGVGANVILGIGDNLEDFTQISPYYRAYFGSKYASGFFIEGFLPITVRTEYEWNTNGNQSERGVDYTTAGLGFGLGGKWIAKKKIVFELNLGIGRKFIGNRGASEPVTGKGMIGVGFAF